MNATSGWSRPTHRHIATRLLVGLVLTVGVGAASISILPVQIAGAATDTVTNCSGSSSVEGSLPYEVANASSGDTISFSVSCPPGSPIVLSSTVDITQNITIEGPGAGTLAVSGDGNVGVFQIDSGVTATISGLTIEDGYTYIGGGVDSSGNLTLTDCTLLDNIASSGAIYSSGTLTITGSTLSGNSAYSSYDGGGGIFNWYGTVTISESTLSDNSATNSNGGAIYSSGTLTITGSTLSGNSATNAGGGIYNDNGGSTTISDSTLSGNSASNYGGGGVLNNLEGSVTVTNSTFWDNSATNGAFAGGIRNVEGTVSLTATIVAGNTSGGDCSGVTDAGYNLDDDGTCGFSGTSLSDTPAGLDPNGLQNNGGPTETIALEPGSPAIGAVTSASLCSTPDQRGVQRPTPCDIGAFESATQIVSNCNDSGPGSLRQAVADVSSGGTVDFALSPSCSTITLTSGDIEIATNLAIDGPGASDLAVSGDNASQVFVVDNGVTASISGLTVEDGFSQPSDTTVSGGGIFNKGALTVTSCVLIDNNGSTSGGSGIFNQGMLAVTNSTIADNSGNDDGGGIFSNNMLTVTNSTISGNSVSPGAGGGIYDYGTAIVTNSTITDNNASLLGGGIFSSSDATLTVTNSTISGNSASDGGGGIYNDSGPLTLTATIVANSMSGDCYGSITDGGYDLDDDGSCGFSGTSLSDTPAGLDPDGLQNNGGPTQTIALEPGSAAIGAVTDPSLCATPDQRGVTRPTPCDIGAYQDQEASQSITFTSVPPSVAAINGPTYGVSATATSGLPVVLTIDSSTSSVCSISDGTVSFTAAGTCVIDANQPGNVDYSAAPQVQQSIPVKVLAITTTSLPSGLIGDRYSTDLAAIGGNPPYTWKLVKGSGTLPKGLKLNKNTGELSGKPKQKGTIAFTVEVFDTKTKTKPHTQNTATQNLSITISS